VPGRPLPRQRSPLLGSGVLREKRWAYHHGQPVPREQPRHGTARPGRPLMRMGAVWSGQGGVNDAEGGCGCRGVGSHVVGRVWGVCGWGRVQPLVCCIRLYRRVFSISRCFAPGVHPKGPAVKPLGLFYMAVPKPGRFLRRVFNVRTVAWACKVPASARKDLCSC
jgi:hypothetical protein